MKKNKSNNKMYMIIGIVVLIILAAFVVFSFFAIDSPEQVGEKVSETDEIDSNAEETTEDEETSSISGNSILVKMEDELCATINNRLDKVRDKELDDKNRDDFEKGKTDCFETFTNGNPIEMKPNGIGDTMKFDEICTVTGTKSGAGTDANIYTFLTLKPGTTRKLLCIYADGTGSNPGWYIEKIKYTKGGVESSISVKKWLMSSASNYLSNLIASYSPIALLARCMDRTICVEM